MKGNQMQKLTEKETEILKLLIRGYDNREIAEALCVSIHTVKAHLTSVFRKLNVKNRTKAILFAMSNNMFNE